MFTPKWKKQAIQLQKGAKKFLNYKRDLLAEDRIKEVEGLIGELKSSIKSKDKDKVRETGKLLEKTCEQALPIYRGHNALAENLEVFFVAIVVALGIRAYFLQPFRIPTNSMYPTQNGVTGTALAKADWPSMPVRALQQATHGRDYFSIRTQSDCRIVSIKTAPHLHFFTRTVIRFSDGHSATISGSPTAIFQAGLTDLMDELLKKQQPVTYYRHKNVTQDGKEQHYNSSSVFASITIPANTVIAEGYMSSGDLILVDKMSYHFRSPERGEVTVFDTRNITEIEARNAETGTLPSHYIKRLIGVPGDTIELRGGNPIKDFHGYPFNEHALLYRNGEKAKEPGILRVESLEGKYDGYSTSAYPFKTNRSGKIDIDYLNLGTSVKLRYAPSTGLSEYWLMGDNSRHSWDSRGWGTVKEYNVTGPALFSLWPFKSGHWGFIK